MYNLFRDCEMQMYHLILAGWLDIEMMKKGKENLLYNGFCGPQSEKQRKGNKSQANRPCQWKRKVTMMPVDIGTLGTAHKSL